MILIALFCWNRRTAPLLVVGLIFLFMTWMPIARSLQQNFPIFESQGVFSRFRVGFLFALSCVASFGVDWSVERARRLSPMRNRRIAFAAFALLLFALVIDLRFTNFELRQRELLRDPYPILEEANMAPVPFRAASGQLQLQPTRRGVNWAEYRYQAVGPAIPTDVIVSRVLEGGAGHLVFSGDIRIEEDPDGLRLYPTKTAGNFRYRFHHAALEIGGWITAISIGAVLAVGLVAAVRRMTRAAQRETD